MRKINLHEKFSQFSEHWKPKIIGELNENHLKLAKLKGEFIWHRHDHEDEFFMVIKGRLRMKFREREVWINEGEVLVVPKGVEHLPVADEEVYVLLIEPKSTLNTGNIINERTVTVLETL